MTTNDLIMLRKKLPPKGEGIRLVAKSTNLSTDYVRKVLMNKRHNQLIIDAAIALAAEYQNDLKFKLKKIHKL